MTKRKTTKPNSGKVAPAAAPAKIRGVSQEPIPKPRAKAKAKAPAKAKAEPVPPIDELVKIVKKEGSTKFHQIRKFLEKANEVDKPTDMLSGYLASRSRPMSPAGRSSTGSVWSPRLNDFHTGLTPSSASRRMPSPVTYLGDEYSRRRDSDEGFAASDLLMQDGDSVTNRIGTFIHGQRGLNLRHKMKTLATGDNLQLALMMEEIPDMEAKLHRLGRDQLRQRAMANTAEDGMADNKENFGSGSLDDSQLAEIETEMLLGL